MLNNGFNVDGSEYKLNQHAYNSLFKSGRKDIMPDDIIDALKTPAIPASSNSVQYINPSYWNNSFCKSEHKSNCWNMGPKSL